MKLGLLAALTVAALFAAHGADGVALEVFGMLALALVVTLAADHLRRRRWWKPAQPTVAEPAPPPLVQAAPVAGLAAGGAWPGEQARLRDTITAFQHECGTLLLDAESARVQTESCESGIRAVEQASSTLAGTCDVLGRRAGLAQSHALMAQCATEDAADALRAAAEQVGRLREHLHGVGDADGVARTLGDDTGERLAAADRAISTALARGEEAARVAAELGGAAARGERVAASIGEACRALAPSLQEGARAGLRLSMLAASLDESAGRVGRMMEAAATGQPPPPVRAPILTWTAGADPSRSRVTQAEGNVLWVRFRGAAADSPGAERA